jgi:hypothetical protein
MSSMTSHVCSTNLPIFGTSSGVHTFPRFSSNLCLSHLHKPHCRLSHYPLIECWYDILGLCDSRDSLHLSDSSSRFLVTAVVAYSRLFSFVLCVFFPGAALLLHLHTLYHFSNTHTLHRHTIANTISRILYSLCDRVIERSSDRAGI